MVKVVVVMVVVGGGGVEREGTGEAGRWRRGVRRGKNLEERWTVSGRGGGTVKMEREKGPANLGLSKSKHGA